MCDSSKNEDFSFNLEDALFRVRYLIQIYGLSQQVRPDVLKAAFGQDIRIRDLQWLIQQFKGGDLSNFPAVETRSRLALGGARSLYAPEPNVIYLAEDFVNEADRDELLRALLQEIVNAIKSGSE